MKKTYIKPWLEVITLMDEDLSICAESNVDIVDDGEGGYEGEWDTKEEKHYEGGGSNDIWEKGWSM